MITATHVRHEGSRSAVGYPAGRPSAAGNHRPAFTTNLFLKSMADDHATLRASAVRAELDRRLQVWTRLRASGGPDGVAPSLINDLRIHRGQMGIFRDLAESSPNMVPLGPPAVGVLHTGERYPDDLSEHGVTYHYPRTDRLGRDANEIAALKACHTLGLPLFFVFKPTPNATTRSVRLGWLQDYDDEARQALIEFGEAPSVGPTGDSDDTDDDRSFTLRGVRATRRAFVRVRPNQWRFRFDVLKRYGTTCAVCSIRRPELLQAAHLCSVEDGGSDDARNGLVFCLTHHRAFDERLFRILPDVLEVQVDPTVTGLDELGITRQSIAHLHRLPHREALQWAARRPQDADADLDMPLAGEEPTSD